MPQRYRSKCSRSPLNAGPGPLNAALFLGQARTSLECVILNRICDYLFQDSPWCTKLSTGVHWSPLEYAKPPKSPNMKNKKLGPLNACSGPLNAPIFLGQLRETPKWISFTRILVYLFRLTLVYKMVQLSTQNLQVEYWRLNTVHRCLKKTLLLMMNVL